MAKSHSSKGSTFLATFDKLGNLVGWVRSHGNFYQKNLIKLVFFFFLTSLFLHSKESPWKEAILCAWHFDQEVGVCVQYKCVPYLETNGDGLEVQSGEKKSGETETTAAGVG